jgi:uncharacterized protein Yka (UPF0111/DUF47 family)
VRRALDAAQAGNTALIGGLAERAKVWESAADRELTSARGAIADGEVFLVNLMTAADDIADDLEEAAFHLTLCAPPTGQVLTALTSLAEPIASASREFVKALLASRHARRGMPREEMDDFLEAVHRVHSLERASDAAERSVKRALVESRQHFGDVFGIVEAARNLEEAADGLMRVSLLLRDRVLMQVVHA